MEDVERYFDWRAVWVGIMTVDEFKAKWPDDHSFDRHN